MEKEIKKTLKVQSSSNKKEQNKHMSIMVLPFSLKKKSIESDAFKFDSEIDSCSEKELKEFIDLLENIERNESKFIDTTKHHSFAANHISLINQKSPSFLKVVTVNQNHYHRLNETFNFNPDVSEISFCNNDNTVSDYKIEFNNSTRIILNDFAKVGYFVFELKITSPIEKSLSDLSKIEFFRYFTNDNCKQNKSKLSVKRNKSENEHFFLTIQNLLDTYFKELLPFIKFQYKKPICLHVFGKEFKYKEDTNALNTSMYKLLRIPPSTESNEIFTPQFLETSNEIVFYGALLEGAVVIDKLEQHSNLFNKYFPSFIFSLNQREVMIQLNKHISNITSKDIILELNSSAKNNYVFDELKELRNKATIFQLKQMFYSISFYHEINQFYQKLLTTFNVELLVKDNKDCISEIHSLIESKREKDKDDEEKVKNKKLETILFILTIAQVWLGIFNPPENLIWRIVFYLVVAFLVLIIVFNYFNKKSKH